MRTNTSSEEQIKERVIELFNANKTLTDIKTQIENAYSCTIEFNTLARIIRVHLGARHRLFVRR